MEWVMAKHVENQRLFQHVGKHLIHMVFMVGMLVAFKTLEVDVSMVTFMALVIGSIAMLEVGLRVIHRGEVAVVDD